MTATDPVEVLPGMSATLSTGSSAGWCFDVKKASELGCNCESVAIAVSGEL
jgi:hypothetical protein